MSKAGDIETAAAFIPGFALRSRSRWRPHRLNIAAAPGMMKIPMRGRVGMANDIMLFALKTSREFGARIAGSLGMILAEHEERDFEDGEHKIRPLVNVRGRAVFVVQSLYADNEASINDKLAKLLFFIGACKDASAASLTAVVPYLCYAR